MDTTDALPSDTQHARELTRRLIAREASEGDGADAFSAAVQAATERSLRELVRWLGANGSRAVVLRALAQVRIDHPALANIRVRPRGELALEGVAESSESHGAMAIAQGLEALLVALFDLLGRLIGSALTAQLVERGAVHPSSNEVPPTRVPDANESPARRDLE